ncbi:uncharacterized protein LOC131658310 [Vicia villosa]|uniref:uncharacterized protein LOC131658310 n=1 Tax=Vicia villosa TaxID=3911 RepID=UPI00273A83C6|nr:uncharacterized protein LOC131658310 [Vicia villosa]
MSARFLLPQPHRSTISRTLAPSSSSSSHFNSGTFGKTRSLTFASNSVEVVDTGAALHCWSSPSNIISLFLSLSSSHSPPLLLQLTSSTTILIGPSDWEDYSKGKEGSTRYRIHNLPENPGTHLSSNQRDSFFDLFQRKEKGADPSLTEFYFRTHRKKDQSWVGVHAESAYDKFEQKKLEISSQNPTIPGEDEADSQPTNEMPPDLDIWVESVGKKKGNRVFGLGTASKTLVSVSKKPSSLSSDSQEVDVLRSQGHALNASLQRQEQEKMVMRQQLHRQEEKMAEANNKISFLMNHLGFVGSSSHPPQPTNENDHTNEDVVDETDEEDLSNEF